jgi:hypothetical protein
MLKYLKKHGKNKLRHKIANEIKKITQFSLLFPLTPIKLIKLDNKKKSLDEQDVFSLEDAEKIVCDKSGEWKFNSIIYLNNITTRFDDVKIILSRISKLKHFGIKNFTRTECRINTYIKSYFLFTSPFFVFKAKHL